MGILWFLASVGLMALSVHYVPANAKNGFDVGMIIVFCVGLLSAISAVVCDIGVWLGWD